MKRSRIFLCDEHPIIVEGIRQVLEPVYEVVGMVTDGLTLCKEALRLKPDLVILGVTLPPLGGIVAAAKIRKALPEIRILFFTAHESSTFSDNAFRAGANGCLRKTASVKDLLHVIDGILSGGANTLPNLLSPRQGSKEHSLAGGNELSMREKEVLYLVAEGLVSKEIAHTLGISRQAVAFHRSNLTRKLRVKGTAALTRAALALDLF